MPAIVVRDKNNNEKDMLQLSDVIFNCDASPSVVHTAVRSYLANQRQGTHATKTRGMVRGGGKKPWKQKHTGRARHGSIRSPLWRGGGVVFGPQPRDYSIKLPKKQRRVALYKALTMKLADGEIFVVDSLNFEHPKTKQMIEILKSWGLLSKTVLVVISDMDKNIILSARNIPTVDVVNVKDLNAYYIASHDVVLFTLDAIVSLQKDVSNNSEVNE
ncbi:MAG: 50S ribosomal protein L4 [Thermodesulfovibrionales bacterium]|nr:50S ribosomal protein L4 [Thermodesulfovibrionales bacterium]